MTFYGIIDTDTYFFKGEQGNEEERENSFNFVRGFYFSIHFDTGSYYGAIRLEKSSKTDLQMMRTFQF
jgi:hypothetical protein